MDERKQQTVVSNSGLSWQRKKTLGLWKSSKETVGWSPYLSAFAHKIIREIVEDGILLI